MNGETRLFEVRDVEKIGLSLYNGFEMFCNNGLMVKFAL